MHYPRKVRTNMRHRGPIETTKMNRNKTDIHADLSSLYYKMQEIGARALAYQERVYNGTEAIQGLGTYSVRLDRATQHIKNVQRGVEHG